MCPALVRSIEQSGRQVILGRVREERTLLIEACLVIEESVCEMKVPLKLVVVKLYRDGVVRVLVDSPNDANEVEAEILSVPTPRRRTGLESGMNLRLHEMAALDSMVVKPVILGRSLATSRISSTIIVHDKVIEVVVQVVIENGIFEAV
jgi:hypothetical protein